MPAPSALDCLSCDQSGAGDFGSPAPLQNMFSSSQQQAQLAEVMVMMRRVYKENADSQQRMLESIIQYHCKAIADKQEVMSKKIDEMVGRSSQDPPMIAEQKSDMSQKSIRISDTLVSSFQSPGEEYDPCASQALFADEGHKLEQRRQARQSRRSAHGVGGCCQQEEVNASDVAAMMRQEESEYPDDDDADVQKSWGVKLVKSTPFEVSFGLMIVANTVNMCVESEYQGIGMGHKLGIPGAEATTADGDKVFEVIDLFFCIIFTLEVILKGFALQCRFWRSGWNVFDFGIIGFAWFERFYEINLPINPMLLRLIRLVRLVRLLRTLSAYEMFDNLFLMVKGIKAATPVLVWVVFLLLPMMSTCALGMNYTLLDFMNDPNNDIAIRKECYKYFGTFSKSMVSIFEITFASFAPICRFLYHKVDEKYAIFFIIYKMVVGISVLRIMYAVFMHVTFSSAQDDEASVIAKKERADKKHADKMRKLFEKFDSGGDGTVDREEFLQLCQDKRVKTFLAALEIDVHDAELVFDLTDDGDGKIGPDEMAHGFTRLKGNARSLDILALTNITREILVKIDLLKLDLGHH